MNLTEHFTFAEVIRSDEAAELQVSNALPEAMMGNARIAAEGMERVRELLGHPVEVTSWYRCPQVNDAVGGAKESAHIEAFAVDFVCPAFGTPKQIVFEIVRSGIRFDKCIEEGRWVHISFDPRLRQQLMTAHFDHGFATYTKGLS